MAAHSKTTCILALSLALSSTACLKTRAQLKEEGPDTSASTAQPVPVEPQGAYVIDELKTEITRLTGRIEELERARQEQASQASKDEIKKLETRIAELEQSQTTLLEAVKKLESHRPPADPAEVFNQGKAQLEAGNLDGAIESFTAYLKTPKAKMAEEATFLRAEAYFNLKQYKKAIIDYSAFPEKFSKSKYMPLALYKIGLSFEAMGMREDARGFYQELVDKFPKTAEAKKARAKLK